MSVRKIKIRDHWPERLLGQHALRPWLQESGSLTARLRHQFRQFSVEPVRQSWASAATDEADCLGLLRCRRVWLRQVLLHGDGKPRVYAHSVLAPSALQGPWRGLRGIGRRPLGEVLFNTPAVRRGQLHFRKLPARHPLRRQAVAAGWVAAADVLWARRSVFALGAQKILVTEVFLPQCAD